MNVEQVKSNNKIKQKTLHGESISSCKRQCKKAMAINQKPSAYTRKTACEFMDIIKPIQYLVMTKPNNNNNKK